MKINFVACYIAISVLLSLSIAPARVAAQQQEPQPTPQQVPQRPHLDDPTYYDRDGATDKPASDKFKAETKAKADAKMAAALAARRVGAGLATIASGVCGTGGAPAGDPAGGGTVGSVNWVTTPAGVCRPI